VYISVYIIITIVNVVNSIFFQDDVSADIPASRFNIELDNRAGWGRGVTMIGAPADPNRPRHYPGAHERPKSARTDSLKYADDAVKAFVHRGKPVEERSPIKAAHDAWIDLSVSTPFLSPKGRSQYQHVLCNLNQREDEEAEAAAAHPISTHPPADKKTPKWMAGLCIALESEKSYCSKSRVLSGSKTDRPKTRRPGTAPAGRKVTAPAQEKQRKTYERPVTATTTRPASARPTTAKTTRSNSATSRYSSRQKNFGAAGLPMSRTVKPPRVPEIDVHNIVF